MTSPRTDSLTSYSWRTSLTCLSRLVAMRNDSSATMIICSGRRALQRSLSVSNRAMPCVPLLKARVSPKWRHTMNQKMTMTQMLRCSSGKRRDCSSGLTRAVTHLPGSQAISTSASSTTSCNREIQSAASLNFSAIPVRCRLPSTPTRVRGGRSTKGT